MPSQNVADDFSVPVILPQLLLDNCCRPYQFNIPPCLNDIPIHVTPTPAEAENSGGVEAILLSAPLMDQVKFSLARGFARTRTENRLGVYALCSPRLDDAMAVDSAVIYSSYTLKADLVALDLEDLADGKKGMLGEEFCSALWDLYAEAIQAVSAETQKDDKRISLHHAATSAGSAQVVSAPVEIVTTTECEPNPVKAQSLRYDQVFARAVEVLRALIGHKIPRSYAKRPRVLYLRNFAAMSYVIHPLIDALHAAIGACEMPVLVVVGIWRASRPRGAGPPTDSASARKQHKLAQAFLQGDSLKVYIERKYTPGKHSLVGEQFTDIADVFYTALLNHRGVRRLVRRPNPFAKAADIEFAYERVLPVIDHNPEPSAKSQSGLPASLIARWNLKRLKVALGEAGIPLRVDELSTQDWIEYSVHADANPIIRRFTAEVIRLHELSTLISSIEDGLPAAPCYADVLDCIRKRDAASGELISRMDALRIHGNLQKGDATLFSAIDELASSNCGEVDSGSTLKNMVVDVANIGTAYEDIFIPQHIIDAVKNGISHPLTYSLSGILSSESVGGFMLYGPPGTGKTMLCRALAKESGVRMLQLRPSDIMSRYVGTSEKLIHSVFALARRIGPCILFIDEMDAIFARRGGNNYPVWMQNILVEFMQEMDGLTTATANKSSNVVIIGATNRPHDVDDAVLRRFPNRFLVDLPERAEREKIIRHYLKAEKTDKSVDFAKIAKRTKHYSGSDLKHVVLQAARSALDDAIKVDVQVNGRPPAKSARPAAPRTPPEATISARHFEFALRGIKASCKTNMAALRQVQRFERSAEKHRMDIQGMIEFVRSRRCIGALSLPW